MKRILDITISLMGIILLAPLLALIGIAIGITSGWPIFFKQLRVGQNGKEFVLIKFRTMQVNHGSYYGIFQPGQDAYLTILGKPLRSYKLDELPQLWNVLRGDMSLVGPRPEVRKWVDAYPERWETILSVKPGITDLASLVYSSEETLLQALRDPERTYREEILLDKMVIYESYVKNHTLLGDLLIILKTLTALIKKPVASTTRR